jgi:RecB family exonuclease
VDTKRLFAQAWADEIQNRRNQSPSFKVEDYVATGKASKEFGGKRGQDWWLANGHTMVDNWVEWRKRTGWEFWTTPTGKPGIELELNIVLPGDIPVKLFIDRVFVMPSGELAILDIKTGRKPENEEQLGLYATGIELAFGRQYRPAWGYFWDGQKGDHGEPMDLSRWTPGLIAALYEEAIAGINAGSFLPKPANACKNWCSVARYCHVVGGSEARGIDPLASA